MKAITLLDFMIFLERIKSSHILITWNTSVNSSNSCFGREITSNVPCRKSSSYKHVRTFLFIHANEASKKEMCRHQLHTLKLTIKKMPHSASGSKLCGMFLVCVRTRSRLPMVEQYEHLATEFVK